MAAFLVAQVICLGVGVADRIVRPRRETELMRVLAPGMGAAALRDQRAERRVGQDVYPRRRGHPCGHAGDDILASIRRETAQSVLQDQVAPSQFDDRRGAAAVACRRCSWHHRWRRAWYRRWYWIRRGNAAPDLLRQRAVVIVDDDAGNRLQQDQAFIVDLIGGAHENAAGPTNLIGVAAGSDQLRDLLLQRGWLAAAILAQDNQVHRESLQAPIRTGLDQLAR